MQDCIFCKIIAGEIPCSKKYEDDQVLAFSDISPQAPVHILIIPKQHLDSVLNIGQAAPGLMDHLLTAANKLAAETGIDQTGFRLVINTGNDGGQSVGHLHMHIMGGRSLKWPPG